MTDMAALAASRVPARRAKATALKAIKAGGPAVFADLLDADRAPALHGVLLWDVLGYAHFRGERSRRWALRRVGVVDEFRTIDKLTERQVAALVELLRAEAVARKHRQERWQ